MSQDAPENQAVAENQPAARQDVPASERSQSIEVVATATSWQAPLPPPAVMRQYEDILPGSAKGIYQRWETQSDHRMLMESAVVVGGSKRSYLGLVFAFILSLAIIASGTCIAIIVHPWAGSSVIGTGIAGLAGVFVYGTNSSRRERERKAADADAGRDW